MFVIYIFELTNKDANVVEENGNRISICTWLIHQVGLRFVICPMLKKVMSRCWLTFMQMFVNFVRTVLTIDTLMRREELSFKVLDLLHVDNMVHYEKSPAQTCTPTIYLQLRNPSQP